MKKIILSLLLIPSLVYSQKRLADVAGSLDFTNNSSIAFNFEVANYFRISKGCYIGPGIAFYKIQDVESKYVPLYVNFVYSGVQKVSPVFMAGPGYGFFTGSTSMSWSPFASASFGVQFNGARTTPYIMASYSYIKTNYKSSSLIRDPQDAYNLFGVKVGIFFRSRD